MQAVRIFALGCLALVLTAGAVRADAKDDAQKALLGKWAIKEKKGDVEVNGVLEFTKDGKLSMKVKANDMEVAIDGTYKLLSDTEIEVNIEFMGQKKTETNKFKVTKEALELTDKAGKVQKFARAK